MKWITREHPKIDRIACPWLIKNFVDSEAEFIYAPFDQVKDKALEMNAIPFDIAGVEFTHYGEKCTFDYIIAKYELKDPALLIIAPIVRGADTDKHDLAPEAAGLWAISAGLAYNIQDDYRQLEIGMKIYDALYSWAKHLSGVKHTQNPQENLLLNVLTAFINQNEKQKKKQPTWVKTLKEMIQDQFDTNLALSLKDVSNVLNVNPSYLSREFSKHFDNQGFGEYIQKARIEKAKELISKSTHTLTEIAYLTGFSDQSHFTRIFKKHTNKNPSEFRLKTPKK